MHAAPDDPIALKGASGDTAPDPFPGDSEMAALMRAFDWAATPIGPPELWPQSLRTSLSI